jgi:hypothetical protein
MAESLRVAALGVWTAVGCLGGALAASGCGATPSASVGDAAPTEDCTDAIDNDGNGLVDCADPACQAGYTCVPSADGWTIGTFLPSYLQGTSPPCPMGYPAQLRVLEATSSGTCSCNCLESCDPLVPDSLPVTVDTTDGGCLEGGTMQVPSSGCVPFDAGPGTSLMFDEPPAGSTGILTQTQSTNDHLQALLCGVAKTGGGCGGGQACVPRPSNEWSVCSFRAALVSDGPYAAVGTCPESWAYALARDGGAAVVYPVATAWDDSQACSPCDCSAVFDAGCPSVSLNVYADPSCQSPLTSITPLTCSEIPAHAGGVQVVGTAGSGPVSGHSQPTGLETSLPDAGYLVCCPR